WGLCRETGVDYKVVGSSSFFVEAREGVGVHWLSVLLDGGGDGGTPCSSIRNSISDVSWSGTSCGL
ncbi:hypothetical protein AVEN_189259-1, partial [Araneus ventricosus]